MKVYQVELSDYDEHANLGCFFSREAAEQHMANLEAEGHGGIGTLSVEEYDVQAHAPEWYVWYQVYARWTEGAYDEIEVTSSANRGHGQFVDSVPYVAVTPRIPHHNPRLGHLYRPAYVSVSLQTLDEEAGKALALRTAQAEIAKIEAKIKGVK